ncbi:UbiA prenyltransferase family-domain-containing protein [Xylariaceae sp. FL0016]|nr:UbiA prenyltransferase family-domain-containing protein [Xylariaceae sp. FL0016]
MAEKRSRADSFSTLSLPTRNSAKLLYAPLEPQGWRQYLLERCKAYHQLARLNSIAPIFLIFFPHLFGILHASITSDTKHTSYNVFYACVLLYGGSFFYSNAAHAWNDIIDAPVDRQVSRSRNRPMARGAISTPGALVFTALQALLATSFLFSLPPITSVAVIPAIVMATYYPWAKLHTPVPQVVLGLCLAWGVMTGRASLGADSSWPLNIEGLRSLVHDGPWSGPWSNPSGLCLMLACSLWTLIYDTIYACQDIPDDTRLGLGSTAVLLGDAAKPALWLFLGLMSVMLSVCGVLAGMGPLYFLFAVGGCLMSVGAMLYNVQLDSPRNCGQWFSHGFWLTGLSITVGLCSELSLR